LLTATCREKKISLISSHFDAYFWFSGACFLIFESIRQKRLDKSGFCYPDGLFLINRRVNLGLI